MGGCHNLYKLLYFSKFMQDLIEKLKRELEIRNFSETGKNVPGM